MYNRSPRRAVVALVAVLALVAGACSRADDPVESGSSDSVPGVGTEEPEETEEASAGLDAGDFGDLEDVCQDGDASGATDVGVTDDAIQVGTVTDKGFTARPGLNVAMYDAAVAFASWCNERGGINGRELVVADRDAAISDYSGQVTASCAEDFALVGGGAVLDETDNGARVECGLPNLPGFAVSETARTADLQVMAVPNPAGFMSFGAYQVVIDQFPELVDRYGVLASSFGAVIAQRDATVAAAEDAGLSVVYNEEYSATGESNWRPFVEAMRDADVQILELVGDPTAMSQVLETMEQVGYRPQIVLQEQNFYEQSFAEASGDIAENVHVRLAYTPLELADQNQATADYLELIERYQPGGSTALLGMQGVSAFLLFARAAAACGSELTRACVLEEASSVSEWSAGGLHPATDPAASMPSPCFVQLDVTPDGFEVNEELTAPTDGIFNCESDNVVEVPIE